MLFFQIFYSNKKVENNEKLLSSLGKMSKTALVAKMGLSSKLREKIRTINYFHNLLEKTQE